MSDDARQDAVRRLLAHSRADEPLPPEVAARLDTLLGELVQARGERARVTSLRRRRRWIGPVLAAAAAAAVVVGVAGISLPAFDGSADDAGSAADTTTDPTDPTTSDPADSQAGSPGAPSGADAGAEAGSAQPEAVGPESAAEEQQAPVVDAPSFNGGAVVLLGVESLTDDVARVLGAGRAPAYASEFSLGAPGCAPAAYGPGRLVPAVYADAAVVLALRPPADGVRGVEVLACGTAEVVRSLEVPLA